MPDEMISVIVPVYNVEKYLEKCIKSIMKQTYPKWELVLVDDGSTDKSGLICDTFAEKDKRIRVLHRRNGGRSVARNIGMEEALGEYLMFVDGDDWIDENCLQDAYYAFDKQVEMVVFRGRNIYTNTVEDKSTETVVRFKGSEPLEFYITGHESFQVLNAVWGKLYRSSLLQDIRFEEGRYYEDIMFTTKIYAACNDCIYMDKAYYNYNIGTDNSITFLGVNELTFRDEIPIFHEKEKFLKDVGRVDLAERYAYFRYQRMISYYSECRRRNEREYTKKIAGLLKEEKPEINQILRKKYVSRYYKVYLRLFLFNPNIAALFAVIFGAIVQLRKGNALC